jgi:hypothetical protein
MGFSFLFFEVFAFLELDFFFGFNRDFGFDFETDFGFTGLEFDCFFGFVLDFALDFETNWDVLDWGTCLGFLFLMGFYIFGVLLFRELLASPRALSKDMLYKSTITDQFIISKYQKEQLK